MDGWASSGLKTFDAFPKVQSSYSIKSTRGGAVTLLLGLICTFMAWVQLAQYIGGVETQQFTVDNVVSTEMQINMDVTVNMPCVGLTVNALDQSKDRLFASELLKFDKVDFDSSNHHSFNQEQKYDDFYGIFKSAKKKQKKYQKSRKLNSNGNACRIYGSLPVTRVQGELIITARGYAWFDRQILGMDEFNFTHVIDEFSFGDFYPKLVNPLDGVVANTKDNLSVYQYFMSVVPTTYVSATTGRVVDTNQYAVTEQVTRLNRKIGSPPGVFFKYDLEPIRLTITDMRMPFGQWLVRLVNIIGGLVVCTSWLYKLLEVAYLRVIIGKGPEKRTLLDTGVQEEHEDEKEKMNRNMIM